MIVLIAMVTGVSESGAPVAIFGANAAMILFGLQLERSIPDTSSPDWTSYILGCVVDIVPWLIIAYQIAGAEDRATGSGEPTFVYGIIASLFVLFNSFAVNMLLQYRQVGRWRDYIFGERANIVLNLAAKTALAGQVFANTLVD